MQSRGWKASEEVEVIKVRMRFEAGSRQMKTKMTKLKKKKHKGFSNKFCLILIVKNKAKIFETFKVFDNKTT